MQGNFNQKDFAQQKWHALEQFIFMYFPSLPLRSQAPQLLYIAHLSSAILFSQGFGVVVVLVPAGQALQATAHLSARYSL